MIIWIKVGLLEGKGKFWTQKLPQMKFFPPDPLIYYLMAVLNYKGRASPADTLFTNWVQTGSAIKFDIQCFVFPFSFFFLFFFCLKDAVSDYKL
jgi:hypothetical protein